MDGFGFVVVVVGLVCLGLDLVDFLVVGFGFVVGVLVGCLVCFLEDGFDLD